MRQWQEYTTKRPCQREADVHRHVVLFEDYAVIDRPSRTYALGHVTRIVCKSKDFKNPVAFNDTRSQDINVYMKMYTRDTDTQYKMSAKISCYGFGDIMCRNFTIARNRRDYKKTHNACMLKQLASLSIKRLSVILLYHRYCKCF